MSSPVPPTDPPELGFEIVDSDEGIPLLIGNHVRPATAEEKVLWDRLQEEKARFERAVELVRKSTDVLTYHADCLVALAEGDA